MQGAATGGCLRGVARRSPWSRPIPTPRLIDVSDTDPVRVGADTDITDVSGERPAAPAEAGNYGGLPDVQTSRQTMNGVKVTPAKCAQATVTGFNSAAFTHAPASVVTFRVGRDGVSEVLVSATPQIASTALGNRLPASCRASPRRWTARPSAIR